MDPRMEILSYRSGARTSWTSEMISDATSVPPVLRPTSLMKITFGADLLFQM
jgi:hypothetical protein